MKDIIKNEIGKQIEESLRTKNDLLNQLDNISTIIKLIIKCFKSKKKLIVFGNGGSAADAQHLATELACKFEKDRKSLPAIALTTNTSLLTAIGNDYGFERTFSRQVESIAEKGDIVMGISTSGNSENVIQAIKLANKKGAITIGLTGKSGGKLKKYVKYCIRVNSNRTARIQEAHVLLIHLICSLVENELS